MKKTTLLLSLIFISSYVFAQKIEIVNKSFSNDIEGWDTGVWAESDEEKPMAIFDVVRYGHDDNSSLKIKVKQHTKDGKGDKIFVKQNDLKLRKGKEYKISFWVRSSVRKDNVMFRIYSGEDTGSSKQWGAVLDRSFDFSGNGKWQNITHTFIADPAYDLDVDYKNLALLFGFDKRIGTFYLDNINLIRVK